MFFLLEPLSYRLKHRFFVVIVVVGTDGTTAWKGVGVSICRQSVWDPPLGAEAGAGAGELFAEPGAESGLDAAAAKSTVSSTRWANRLRRVTPVVSGPVYVLTMVTFLGTLVLNLWGSPWDGQGGTSFIQCLCPAHTVVEVVGDMTGHISTSVRGRKETSYSQSECGADGSFWKGWSNS